MTRCAICGYEPSGEGIPGTCPVCGADSDQFRPVSDLSPPGSPKDPDPSADGRWRCAVCKYEHAGSDPPDPCPVCGAPPNRFLDARRPTSAPFEQTPPSATQWRCTVCGYIHTGSAPPEVCPVCGADASKFIPVSDEPVAAPPSANTVSPNIAIADPERQWRCTVCGYIHVGEEPPERCPVCGAPKEKFRLISQDFSPDKAQVQLAEPEPITRILGLAIPVGLSRLLVQLHAHPIAVHIPNGLAPVSVAFLILAILLDNRPMEMAAFLNMGVVALAMPAVILTGVHDWQYRFQGTVTPVFTAKLASAGIVWSISTGVVLWRWAVPEIAFAQTPARWLYLGLHLVLFGAAALAGYMGGKLVFGPNDN